MLDFILEIADQIAASFADWTARGFVLVFSVSSLALATIAAWLIVTSSDPLHQPAWGLGVFASGITIGLIGLFLSVLHLIRDETDQHVGTICVGVNATAVLIPALWLMAR